MSLSLVTGPAHAGKVALLLERFVEVLDRDPWLIVPNRSDVDRVERELVARRGALLSGTVSTFDMLFEHLARAGDGGRRVLGDAERALVVRRVVTGVSLDGLARSARFPGFADALAAAFGELESSLLEPDGLERDLAQLYRAYRDELEGIGAWDRDVLRRRAVERVSGQLDAWDGRPVIAYGFEDLTGAEWRLLEALAARGEVHVSLPYEPGRPVFASLARTARDLASLADGRIVELSPRSHEYLPEALAHIERHLFDDDPPATALADGSVRFLEGAGRRGTLELVAEEILALVADGMAPESIAVICPSVDRLRVALESAFSTMGVPFAVESRMRLGATPLGQALLALLRFAWLGGTRSDLFSFLRTPYSGFARSDVDWLEGRLRGRAVTRGERVLQELEKLRGGRSIPLLDVANGDGDLQAVSGSVAELMLRNAYGMEAPPVTPASRRDMRALDTVERTLAELERLAAAGIVVTRDDVLASLDRATVPGSGPGEPGQVAVLDLARARTRQFETAFLVGLEQGSLPRRMPASPFLDDDVRRELDERRGARLERPDAASRDRYLFYTACTRATARLTLVREAASDDGSPREPSPFWDAVRALFDPEDGRRHTVRRPLSKLTWPLEAAPTERERLRALAALAASDRDGARSLALANGWERKLTRAQHAFSRPTALRSEAARGVLQSRETFRVTDLERMAGCSSAWFVERHLRPGQIDQDVDPRMRGSIAHVALQRFYSQLPSAIPGAERVTPEHVEDAVRLMRDCVESAITSGLRIDVSELQRRELEEGLQRDLEQLVRDEAAAPSPFVPRRLEVAFSSYELAEGVAVSGKIDRVDADPMSARGVVIDYKSGAAPSAAQIREEQRLQIPLYMLVLRDQLGLEPMGGVYIPLGGSRRARGMLRGGDEAVPGYATRDYLDADTFATEIVQARELAVELARRIRAGDVRHDPRGGDCPAWCDLWRICRKERP